jgi:uncharacterized iron-regulated membrane protein
MAVLLLSLLVALLICVALIVGGIAFWRREFFEVRDAARGAVTEPHYHDTKRDFARWRDELDKP